MRVVKGFRRLTQTGDTIVEVLLVLTVISLVLGASTAMSGRSTSNLQQTQESAVADRIARGQLEYLKTYVRTLKDKNIADPANGLATAGFCMSAQNGQDSDPRVPKKDGSCATSQVVGGASYTTAITVTPAAGDPGVFDVNVKVTWDGINVRTGNIDVYYRIYNITGAQVALQTGQLCQTGYRHRDGTTGPCVPIDPSVRIVTRSVTPDTDVWGGKVEPNCNKGSYGPLNNINVRLSEIGAGAAAPRTGQTTQDYNGLSSSALFSPLKKSGTYRAEVISFPSTHTACGPDQSGAIKVEEGQEEVATFTAKPRIPKQATVNVTSKNYPSWHLFNNQGDRHWQDFTFTNPASSTTDLTGINTTLSNTTHFKNYHLNTCTGSLRPGESCSVRVYFWPPAGYGYDYLGNAGVKTGTLSLTNTNGVSPTVVPLSGKTVASSMAPGDTFTQDKIGLLKAFRDECYNNADACGARTFVDSSNGNLVLSERYCRWGGYGSGDYDGLARLEMQASDGNFVYYTSRFNSATNTYAWFNTHAVEAGLWFWIGTSGSLFMTKGPVTFDSNWQITNLSKVVYNYDTNTLFTGENCP